MRIHNNKRGSIIFPMIIATAIIAFSISYFYSSALLMRKLEDHRLLFTADLSALSTSIKSLLQSQNAFINSAQRPENGSFWNCLNDPNFDCNVPTEQDFYLVKEEAPTTFFVDATAGRGFTVDLEACNTYPSLECPFRYELKWLRECVGLGPCYSPDMYIKGQLLIAPLASTKFTINSANYAITVKVR